MDETMQAPENNEGQLTASFHILESCQARSKHSIMQYYEAMHCKSIECEFTYGTSLRFTETGSMVVPSADMVAHNHLQLQVQGIQCSLLPSMGCCLHVVNMNSCKHTHIHMKIIKRRVQYSFYL